MNHVNAHLLEISHSLHLDFRIAYVIFPNKDTFHIQYPKTFFKTEDSCEEQLERIIDTLFERFNAQIAEPHTQEEKIVLIADLFQKLEFLHPFPDGCGRTDLILLAKLLSEHGAHPAILDKPYTSTFCPLLPWVEYLKEGMSKWELEAGLST